MRAASPRIEATADQVLTSAYATGIFVNRLNNHKTLKVLVIGSNDLKSEIARFGAIIVESAPCEILVVGFDREFSYEKICAGLNALRQNPICIACNRDASFPAEGGQLFPGCGAMVGALEGAWGRQADYEVGKPSTILLQLIAAEFGLQPSEILVFGDCLESDIAMANRFGSPSVLVTTCERPRKESLSPDLKPTMALASLKDLADILCQLGGNR